MTNWLNNVVALNVKPNSMQTYQWLFNKQIILHLGECSAQRRQTLHQIIQFSGKGYFFTTPKTESSNRYFLIDDYLLGELKRWQAQ